MTIVTNNKGEWEFTPQSVPTVAADVFVGDCHILEIHLINTTSGAVTATINDKQGSPQPVIPPTVSIPGNSDMIWEFTGRYAPGGVNWVASGAGIVGYVRGR
jgi:hypothetical protein